MHLQAGCQCCFLAWVKSPIARFLGRRRISEFITIENIDKQGAAKEEGPHGEEATVTQPSWLQAALTVLDAYKERDPAAESRLEVALTATGLHAVLWHHMCHGLWNLGLQLLARLVANVGRWLFGVEIHPAVRIGKRLFIDHGSGIVIGMTAELGDDVSIYQGVTLGGVTQVGKGKRHPTLNARVVVGAGAKILGPIVVGEDARVGSNAVVVKEVKAGATVVGIPAHEVGGRNELAKGFVAYAAGTEAEDEYVQLKLEVARLSKELAKLRK